MTFKEWDSWRIDREIRRKRFAWFTSFAFVVLVVAGLCVSDLFRVLQVGELGDTIGVKIGSPEGEDVPFSVMPQSDPVLQSLTSQDNSQFEITTEAEAKNAIPVQPTPVKPVKEAQNIPSKKEPVPSNEKQTETAFNPIPDTDENAVPRTVKIKGSETGNSLETTFEGVVGRIGRSLYVPIYLFMPLPKTLDPGIVTRIPGSKGGLISAEKRRDDLLAIYEKAGKILQLKSQPEFGSRPSIWIMLRDAGYDIANAEYKAGKNLYPVTLRFRLTASESGHPPVLSDLRIASSSGDPDIDQAVFYGFQQSAFANGTGQTTEGRFVYDFKKLN